MELLHQTKLKSLHLKQSTPTLALLTALHHIERELESTTCIPFLSLTYHDHVQMYLLENDYLKTAYSSTYTLTHTHSLVPRLSPLKKTLKSRGEYGIFSHVISLLSYVWEGDNLKDGCISLPEPLFQRSVCGTKWALKIS